VERSLTPAHLRSFWPDFDWHNPDVWALDTPTTNMEIADLLWLLDLPLWSSRPPEPLFDLRPRDVLDHPTSHPLHAQRVQVADLLFPLELLHYRGRWVVLDGLHRLARLVDNGAHSARVRCHPSSAFPRPPLLPLQLGPDS
jgi:hypothetical protein